MFILHSLVDTIRIPPYHLHRKTLSAIHHEIDEKYPSRVLMDVGLVIARHGSCLQHDHGILVAGDGASHHKCKFRLVVFQPFVDEVMVGTILHSSPQGIIVSLGFFESILIAF